MELLLLNRKFSLVLDFKLYFRNLHELCQLVVKDSTKGLRIPKIC